MIFLDVVEECGTKNILDTYGKLEFVSNTAHVILRPLFLAPPYDFFEIIYCVSKQGSMNSRLIEWCEDLSFITDDIARDWTEEKIKELHGDEEI